jgi:hypothetical protein
MNFIPANKYAECVPIVNTTSTYFDFLQLQPDESYAFAFHFTKYDDLVGRIAGYPLIKWCSSLGEFSIFRGEDTTIKVTQTPTALLPQPVKFLLVSSPSIVSIGDTFEIIVRIVNTTVYPWPLRLDCPNFLSDDNNNNNNNEEDPGLYFTEITAMNLGNLESNDFIDVNVTLYASIPGLFDLPYIYAVHAKTKERFSSGKLCSILVQETCNLTEEEEAREAEETNHIGSNTILTSTESLI